MTQIVQTTIATRRPLHRLAQPIQCSLGAIRGEMRARKAARALRELDDHLLTDMGLARGEIAFAVREGR
ncbi:DUF1127 domain-containing protein [Mesorhizobium sangaii]|uniref:Uncharacterized protein YjiS (DUF1127 family) n=1 Tax=Mesorhizobium sangaii TaxID=505389 RepID=A0A841PQ46_9HYPH|nr:DUF1127 domain-containing protein [Mesorhizobium sangaii]MBB6412259.1 uncharacterized protein YjiS (DUF1127 family) [Mesorhizobium sangaii]